MKAVPWHRSLFTRLFGTAALIALIAVAAATWASVRSTTVAVRQEQRDSLHADAEIYDALIGYAATHRSWAGVGPLVRSLASNAGEQVTVTDSAGVVLVSSADTGQRASGRAWARLDPLDIDTVLLFETRPSDGAAGSPAEQQPSSRLTAVPCAIGSPSCRRYTVSPTTAIDRRVPSLAQHDPRRWRDVQNRVDTCLSNRGLPRVLAVTRSFGAIVGYQNGHAAVATCVDAARRAALSPYVAAPAELYVGHNRSRASVFWDLSRGSTVRIGLLAGAVLAATLLLCALLAGSIARPLRRMATTAQLAAEGDLAARVPARRHDEVGEVALAFNRMADRRQELEDARRRMVSDVSHELRAPLANVRGWIEAAQDGLAPIDAALLASLHEEGLHLQRLVEDLHDLSLGDAGELRLELTNIDLGAFLDQVADGFRAGDVALTACAEPGSSVYADPVRLRQAVVNLIANAIRHTPASGHVTLRGAVGRIEVEDDGEGIPADDLPHVFERFRRVDPSRSRTTGGSGLGLAIVKQIAQAHGGAVSIRSSLGQGTVVTLSFPTRDRDPLSCGSASTR